MVELATMWMSVPVATDVDSYVRISLVVLSANVNRAIDLKLTKRPVLRRLSATLQRRRHVKMSYVQK